MPFVVAVTVLLVVAAYAAFSSSAVADTDDAGMNDMMGDMNQMMGSMDQMMGDMKEMHEECMKMMGGSDGGNMGKMMGSMMGGYSSSSGSSSMQRPPGMSQEEHESHHR